MIRQFLKNRKIGNNSCKHSVNANKALFTAMATSLGIGSMIAPIVAIGFGGPGALFGFLLATIFGGSSTFSEVYLALKYRKKLSNGKISGGPMEYIKSEIGQKISKVYAIFCFILIASWGGNQSNTIASLLDTYKIPPIVSGCFIAFIILTCLVGGIKRVGSIAEKVVPIMFILYSLAGLWIILLNISKLPGVIKIIFQSAFSSQAIAGATIGVGIYKGLRWGLAKGFYSNESGLGTASIPHSMSESENPMDQSILSIVSVYSNGFLCILTGLIVLITGVWQEPGVSYNINLLVKALSKYFPTVGPLILVTCSIMFAFTTILGNGYNGSQCFLYATNNKGLCFYYTLTVLIILLGSIAKIELVWTLTDFLLVPVALINMISIITIIRRKRDILKI